MEQEYKFMVCTSCMTYNHAPYIVDAMNGFTMQETTFPVYYLITDDASTDGEPDVIKQYLADFFQTPYRTEETDDYHLICATHKTNPNCNFIVFLLKYNHYSIKKSKLPYQAEWRDNAKYIALCEGDDYWIDPMKLQKQAIFLDAHPDYNLVYTNVNSYKQKEGVIVESFFDRGIYRKIKNTHQDFVLWGWFLAPCTWLFRNHVVTYPAPLDPNKFYGDIFILLCLSEKGKVHFIKESTAVYRVLNESMSHSKDSNKKFSFWRKGILTRSEFAAKQSLFFKIKFLAFSGVLLIKCFFDSKGTIKVRQCLLTFKDVIIDLFILK